MRHARIPCLLLALLSMVGLPGFAQDADEPKPDGGEQQAAPADPIAHAIAEINKQDNGLTLDPKNNSIDIQATVVMRTGEFLEMFACTTDTREHESILVIDAMPSTIHLALILLGQEPGKPLAYDMKHDPPKLVPATGPKVGVFIVYEVADQEREVAANRWVQDNKTKEMMEGNDWLFAGSQFAEFEGKQIYHADLNGSAISLVNFGDDLLTLPNKLTDANASHDKVWAPRTKAIPKVGTKVRIRLKVTDPEDQEAAEKQGEEPKPPPPLPLPKDPANSAPNEAPAEPGG